MRRSRTDGSQSDGREPIVDVDVNADALEKSYGETVALSGVSLTVGPGEVVGLIGPNGAGKTTLVRALTGTTVPDSGSATILGAEPSAVDRDRLAVLPQDFSPPDRLTARELLAYYAGLYDEARDPETVLEDVGLEAAGDTWYESLSGGQQRRVCVGAALVNDPDLLFLDEPTTGIDPAGRRTVWGLLEDLAAGGTTIVLTTHDMAEAERLADRVGLLANGSLLAQGAPAELVAEHGGSSRLRIELESTGDGADDSVDGDNEPSGRDADTSADRQPADTGTDSDVSTATVAFESLPYPVDSSPNELVVRDLPPTDIGDVVEALEAAGVSYTGLEWAEPSLEDVYLSLAGDLEGGSVSAGGEPGREGRARDEVATDGGECLEAIDERTTEVLDQGGDPR
ncbi:ABC transporter ATP-binding protein [Natronosalvus halobius]|uniref:ABC transporter ATP-binding protein n=1 Tax=Natronosalvus halobius TaxID=2953746 RepID=UPI0020A116DF|nr:ABC transporter ATP-binding protein [Natronosalvus halobius]USZ73113.1 ABC transporter ATP-binding protein [Natronosalvus halobius]